MVDLDDLLSAPQIAARHGVGHAIAHRWTTRADFPSPVRRLGRCNVWLAEDVDRWRAHYEATKSRGGRPRIERESRAKIEHEPAVYPCPVKGCTNKCKLDFRGNVLAFCRKHMEQMVWS